MELEQRMGILLKRSRGVLTLRQAIRPKAKQEYKRKIVALARIPNVKGGLLGAKSCFVNKPGWHTSPRQTCLCQDVRLPGHSRLLRADKPRQSH